MAVTARDLIANGVKPAYAENLAAKINSLDPAVQNRYANTVVQFYQQYGPQGYDLDINQAARTAAEQRALRATGVKAALPRNTWHVGGGAADFTVYRNGKRDTGTKAGNAYQAILAPIAKANGLANPIRNDVGHFQPVEFSLSRRGQAVAAAIDPARGTYPSLFGREPLTAADVPVPVPRPTRIAAATPSATEVLSFAPVPGATPAQQAAAEQAIPSNTQVAAYIQDAAQARGINPGIALRVAQAEGLNNLTTPESGWQSRVPGEQSFGPYQLYMGGGLGNEFQRTTGLDPRDPNTVFQQVDFALDHAAENGWSDFHGAARIGIGRTQGIGSDARAIGSGDRAWLANPAMTNIPADAPYGANRIINAAMAGDPGALKAALDAATQSIVADMTGPEKVAALLGNIPERITTGLDAYQRALVQDFPSVMRMAQTQLNANRQLAAVVPDDMRQQLQSTFSRLPPVPLPTPRPQPGATGGADARPIRVAAGGMPAPAPLAYSGDMSAPAPSWNRAAADTLRQVSRLFGGGGSAPLTLPAYSPQPGGPEDFTARTTAASRPTAISREDFNQRFEPPASASDPYAYLFGPRPSAPFSMPTGNSPISPEAGIESYPVSDRPSRPSPAAGAAAARELQGYNRAPLGYTPPPAASVPIPTVTSPPGRLSPEYVPSQRPFASNAYAGLTGGATPTAMSFLGGQGFVGAAPMVAPTPVPSPAAARALQQRAVRAVRAAAPSITVRAPVAAPAAQPRQGAGGLLGNLFGGQSNYSTANLANVRRSTTPSGGSYSTGTNPSGQLVTTDQWNNSWINMPDGTSMMLF